MATKGRRPLLISSPRSTAPPPEDGAGRCLGGTRSRVSGEAPPGHSQIVLTPVDGEGGSGALPTAPCMWEKTVAAVWRIRSLHLSRTKAQYLTPHLVVVVPFEDLWVTMQQLAQPASEVFVAKAGDDMELYGAFCPLPARLQQPVPTG